MKKLNLYDIEVLFVTPKGQQCHIVYVAARNVKGAFVKASNRIAQSPHGFGPRYWKLTGNYKLMGKVFI